MLPEPGLAEAYSAKAAVGCELLRSSSVAFVGLARNCGLHLEQNLLRLEYLAAECREWRLHIEENDSEDNTVAVLAAFAQRHRRATFTSRRLGRDQYGPEFGGRRTIALAEYRTACQEWVRDCAAEADFVVVTDWDAWGGWWNDGVFVAAGWLAVMPEAYGMASVSLMQHPAHEVDQHGKVAFKSAWLHYDAWALRGVGQRGNYEDDYSTGRGGWKHQWLPPVGTAPVLVSSAFGGMAIYRTAAYLAGEYRGETDCEHVSFHKSVAEATKQSLYVCPAMRTIMHWMEPVDGGQHLDD